MKKLFKKSKSEIDFSNLSSILNTSVAAGVAIANYSNKNPKIIGMITAGLSLLATGLIIASDDNADNK
ncbi:hypothetical protein [Flavobacterium reichenbachii]|uniref:Uncharacterized protein n=1 Tax=Flavobacterium reichenbachii TaxID=362418 RepID=A0A085ZKU4_9FLAO|nr:hypothetical protein [Flavobacterium reichenbachii]KFF05058.1 hypothetical protein IW19_05730 [Flavobacterium reichenbachii]OXB16271.1 hypothetical protein B0A68_08420 [Flavobacterium reichenbachii]